LFLDLEIVAKMNHFKRGFGILNGFQYSLIRKIFELGKGKWGGVKFNREDFEKIKIKMYGSAGKRYESTGISSS